MLVLAQLVSAQVAPNALTLGENTKMNAGGMFTFGYAGDYGDAIPSSHGLNLGVDGRMSGYYYNPNFLSFSATPYYNQSRADSSYQSLTGASGIDGTANFFTGSNFPGSVAYHYDRNSSGTFRPGRAAEFHDDRQRTGILDQLECADSELANTFRRVFGGRAEAETSTAPARKQVRTRRCSMCTRTTSLSDSGSMRFTPATP